MLKFISLVLPLTFAMTAMADENAFSHLNISQSCVNKIFKAAIARCNYDSKNDPSREHACAFWGQLELKKNKNSQAFFFIDFTVTDAVVYAVPTYISDKDNCVFKVYKSQN